MISEIPEFSDRAAPPGSGAIADAVPRLALRALGRSFGAEVAVDDLNLEIAKGEFISLLGPSGCGKSTTLRMIAGFIRPSAGVIEKDQVIIASAKRALPPEKRDMVMIFQSYALWPHKTVAENVAFGLRLRKLDNASIHRSEEFADRMPHWKKHGLIIKYLSPYSPELNLIEILWRRIKYTWLPFSAYACLNALSEALETILSQVGSEYQITFA